MWWCHLDQMPFPPPFFPILLLPGYCRKPKELWHLWSNGGREGVMFESVCVCVCGKVRMRTQMLIFECTSTQLFKCSCLCMCLSPFFFFSPPCPISFQWLRKEESTLIIFAFGSCNNKMWCGDFKWGVVRVTFVFLFCFFPANHISHSSFQ